MRALTILSFEVDLPDKFGAIDIEKMVQLGTITEGAANSSTIFISSGETSSPSTSNENISQTIRTDENLLTFDSENLLPPSNNEITPINNTPANPNISRNTQKNLDIANNFQSINGINSANSNTNNIENTPSGLHNNDSNEIDNLQDITIH